MHEKFKNSRILPILAGKIINTEIRNIKLTLYDHEAMHREFFLESWHRAAVDNTQQKRNF